MKTGERKINYLQIERAFTKCPKTMGNIWEMTRNASKPTNLQIWALIFFFLNQDMETLSHIK